MALDPVDPTDLQGSNKVMKNDADKIKIELFTSIINDIYETWLKLSPRFYAMVTFVLKFRSIFHCIFRIYKYISSSNCTLLARLTRRYTLHMSTSFTSAAYFYSRGK